MSESGPRWYVVQSQPNAERKAVSHLQRQGFVTYLPRYLKQRRHARRVELTPAPLFPRYLFVAIELAGQRWRCIHSTIGVSQLVTIGDLPAAVPDQVIEALRARQDASGYIQLAKTPYFRRGEKIRVLDGAFADFLGLYDGIQDSDRVAILLDLLGRKVRVSVNAVSVVAA